MKILAIETSTPWCSVALHVNGDIESDDVLAGQRHSELLLPMVDALLRKHSVEVKALDGIAFGSGPGSFTGLRIACGVAQGMAMGAQLRLAPVCTLLALAEASGRERVLSCLDARMGELYLAVYERVAGEWHTRVEPILCRAETAPDLEGVDWYGCGSGFLAQGEGLMRRYGGQLCATGNDLVPRAREMVRLALPMFSRGEGVLPEEAAPIYVRNKVAMTTHERAQLSSGASASTRAD